MKLLRLFGKGAVHPLHTPTSPESTSPAEASLRDAAGEIVFYATPWCGDCHRARRIFASRGVAYRYVDIDQDAGAGELVMRLNGGMRSVPTIIFPDGGVLVEPSSAELEARLGPYMLA
jgi:mycoredoxin